MTAPARRRDAVVDIWHHAVEIRKDWYATGLDTAPADRTAAEHSITRIYQWLSRARPRFVWADSPQQALPLITGLPTHDVLLSWIRSRRPPGPRPLASDLVVAVSRLRTALDAGLDHPELDPPPSRRRKPPWIPGPPLAMLASGIPLREVLRLGLREAPWTSLTKGFTHPVRARLAAGRTRPLPEAWYGQQESWIAYYDAVRRLGLARFAPADDDRLADWVTLARSCGWWWPGEHLCVVVERPATVHTEPVPGGWHDETRLRRGDRPAVRYRDGTTIALGAGRPY